jgi:hypothetical protein
MSAIPPLSGDKQTSREGAKSDASDPDRTSPSYPYLNPDGPFFTVAAQSHMLESGHCARRGVYGAHATANIH